MELNNFKVLYVDDEDAWRVVFQRTLNGVFDVITARNTEEGWDLLKKHADEIGVIISDQRMPGRPGIELLKQARAYFPKIVRIITTGYSDSNIAVHATNQGAIYHYISKPWNSDELLSVVKRSMDFFLVRRERDNLLERKLSTIQRKNLESKLQCLLVFAISNSGFVRHSTNAMSAYLGSVGRDPGEITDIKSIFRQSQSELGTILVNLDLVNQLNDLPSALNQFLLNETVEVRNLLLKVRDGCSHLIYSVRNPLGSRIEDLTELESFLGNQLLSLIQCWIAGRESQKLVEISESRKDRNDVGSKNFVVRIGNYDDPYPWNAEDDPDLFNGINLENSQELEWIRFLMAIYHFGGVITPHFVSRERIMFEMGEFRITDEPNLDPKSVMAELIRKFEAWNYRENNEKAH